MIESIFPIELSKLVSKYVNMEKLFEIRIRLDAPIILNISNDYYFLSNNGLTKDINESIFTTQELISKIVYIITESSMYSVNNQLKEGFITTKNGIRIGIAGEVVYENNRVITIKNISYLNIRIPHAINNCSKRIFDFLIDKPFNNTIIISPPGMGKTTFLRDIMYQIYKNKYCLNCLLIDERYEIAGLNSFKSQFDVGIFTDILSGCKKQYGFENGIRSMSPDIIFTDEISTSEDCVAIENAISSGVSIVTTTHSRNLNEFIIKPIFKRIIENKYFKRFIVLSKRKGVGTIDGLYDENYKLLYRD